MRCIVSNASLVGGSRRPGGRNALCGQASYRRPCLGVEYDFNSPAMVAPTALLAGTWGVLLAGGVLTGMPGIVVLGATAAAVPLWFLANYTIDTAVASYLLPRFRKRPVLVAGALLLVFGTVEALRFAQVPAIGHINWVIGWLLFQVIGFAWSDDLLPRGPRC